MATTNTAKKYNQKHNQRRRYPKAHGEPWHLKSCPLYEINESDCNFYPSECTCGFIDDPRHPAY